jgi:hypothetical protein
MSLAGENIQAVIFVEISQKIRRQKGNQPCEFSLNP